MKLTDKFIYTAYIVYHSYVAHTSEKGKNTTMEKKSKKESSLRPHFIRLNANGKGIVYYVV